MLASCRDRGLVTFLMWLRRPRRPPLRPSCCGRERERGCAGPWSRSGQLSMIVASGWRSGCCRRGAGSAACQALRVGSPGRGGFHHAGPVPGCGGGGNLAGALAFAPGSGLWRRAAAVLVVPGGCRGVGRSFTGCRL